MKRLAVILAVAALGATMAGAQQIVGDDSPGVGSALNQQHQQRPVKGRLDVVVFTGDSVIPQFVDGGSWKTTMKFLNLENHTVQFTVLFFTDSGADLYIPIVGVGVVRNVTITLAVAGSITVETAGVDFSLSQGWALMMQQVSSDSIGGMAIFRQRVPGVPDQEAVVPIVNRFSDHFVLLFDNTAFVTGIAIANPNLGGGTVSIPVTIRNERGQIIDQEFIVLGVDSHTAFSVPDKWPATIGQRGAIEFLTSGFGVGALGLRFNGTAFTSFHVLENINWVAP